MKKLMTGVTVLLLIAALAGCGKTDRPETNDKNSDTVSEQQTAEVKQKPENPEPIPQPLPEVQPPEEEETQPEHAPATEDNIVPHEEVGYCGNTVTTVSCRRITKDGVDSWEKSFIGGDSVYLTDLLSYLDYSDDICKCLPDYTVTTEMGTSYGVSLTDGYARCGDGQTQLTEEQLQRVTEIIDTLSQPDTEDGAMID